jgi:hypothetical protein
MAIFGYGADDDKSGSVSVSESIRDMFNGGGAGRSGSTFQGGLSSISNAIGATPSGSKREPTGIAKIVSGATGIGGGRENPLARTVFGALTGGIPGAIMSYAMANKNNKAFDAEAKEQAAKEQAAAAPVGIASVVPTPKGPGYTTSEDLPKIMRSRATVLGYAEGGEVEAASQPNEKSIISSAAAAISGDLGEQEAAIALGMFVQKYGEEALRDFVERVQSGELEDSATRSEGKLAGPGDGMNDRIPASVGGQKDVLLSDGEFIVPADVVSGLGNGSSEAGAKQLEKFMGRIRSERTGKSEQPKAIDPAAVLPA